MGRVYKTSRNNLICLGGLYLCGKDEESIRNIVYDAASIVNEVHGMIQQVFSDPAFIWRPNDFPWHEKKENDPLVLDTRWNAWDKMLQHPWFSRGWMVQEAAFGPNASVVWTKSIQIPWISVLMVNYWVSWRLRVFRPAIITMRPLHSDLYWIRQVKEATPYWPFEFPGIAEAGELVPQNLDYWATAQIVGSERPHLRFHELADLGRPTTGA